MMHPAHGICSRAESHRCRGTGIAPHGPQAMPSLHSWQDPTGRSLLTGLDWRPTELGETVGEEQMGAVRHSPSQGHEQVT